MEKKKNNALEKVENIAGNSSPNGYESESVQMAKINADKNEEKQRIKLAKQREKNRVKYEREKMKIEQKEEKEKRAHELKKERRKNKNGKGGFVAAIISLSIVSLVLAGVLSYTLLMPSTADKSLEAGYSRAFYNTVDYVDNIDLNLSKAFATNDRVALQGYLTDTAINSELAENDLQSLPLQDESKFYTTKLVNQIGDYSKYLNKKLARGESLTDEDMSILYRLYEANKTFKASLSKMMDGMTEDYSFSSMAGSGNGNIVIEGFNELQNLSVEYPELIYDGPFSDGINEREIKGLSGEEVSKDRAIEMFNSTFANYGVEDTESVGETAVGIICYNIQAQVDGELLYAQFSKKGGKLIMFSYAGSCKDTVLSEREVMEKANAFLEKGMLYDMKPVWIDKENNVYTINYAYETNGVIVYSDLVKVRVCAETGMVIGFEASSYYTNHTDRVIESPAISKATALSKVSSNIEVETSRLAVVPIGTKTEKLCYEFSGTYDGETYYVYIDAINGAQVELFKVIRSTEGTLLM